MPHISLRIDQELYDKIESIRGDKDRSTYIKEVLVAHLGTQSNTSDTQSSTESNTDVAHLYQEIEYLKKKLDESGQEKMEILNLLHQEQSLHLQTQRQLIPTAEKIAKKAWWQFWKK